MSGSKMSFNSSTTSNNLAFAAFDAILASDNDMDALDILAFNGIHPAITAAMATSVPSYNNISNTEAPPPPYSSEEQHVSFDDAAFKDQCEPSLHKLKRTVTPYPPPQPSEEEENCSEPEPEHINFCNEALCHGAPKPCRLQRTLTPVPQPQSPPKAHKHHHINLRHIHLHLPHPHLNRQLKAWINKELTAIRHVLKEQQLKTLRGWEEHAAVDEEVRRLYLEDKAFWADGKQIIW